MEKIFLAANFDCFQKSCIWLDFLKTCNFWTYGERKKETENTTV
jgi:hypothetical protein